ncbi:MAG: polyphosphate kinase 1 [Phaeodactylibacter sp.]|nr:polyphosphate kinase 1 [Phaeodactylibacter sp.]MCB0613511.1 polyphosphate kinase 1 [Phaeodactylibacter sp.]
MVRRDISWLSFNHRVLQEAKDKSVPLYERIKFLAIYSSNLDEFYRVRVASLRSFKDLKKKDRRKLELEVKPKKELREIRRIVEEQQEAFGRIFREEVLPELESHNIFLVKDVDFTEAQQAFARKFFIEKIYPNARPIFLGPEEEAPFLKNRGLYFFIEMEAPGQSAVVEIPSGELPRFVGLPSDDAGHHLTFLDDILRYNLDELLGQPFRAAYAVKLSRDAELYIDDEYSGDLLDKLKNSLEKRNVGLPTRFLYDAGMPDILLKRLRELFGLSKDDLIPGARYHNFNDFFGFPNPTGDASLHGPSLPPLPHPELEGLEKILPFLNRKDAMLHFPYQKYDYVPQLIDEAANDPLVKSIKITLYRVASKSAIVDSLLKARENGKQVTAFIEAKARFDEESNIYWGEQLEKAGALVFYSYPGIKVHTKLLLIQRKETEGLRNYAYLGTGNFNEKTARVYGDHALLTGDKRLADEVAQIFMLLEKKILIPKCKHLFVSPFTTRDRFTELVEREIEHARNGKEAYMILKMNSLEDPDMIEKLYEASNAGVRIQLIIRGICCLAPGVKGMSENIEAISILDHFLEHARVYIFGNGGQEVMYTASADWMSRNLDRRVEAVMPILDEEVYGELRHIINLQLNDNTKARWIDAEQSNAYKKNNGLPVRAQWDTYAFLREKAKHLVERKVG